jgi:hypothetical protein
VATLRIAWNKRVERVHATAGSRAPLLAS